MRKLLFLLLLCSATITGFPSFSPLGGLPATHVVLKEDSTKVTKRNFDAQKLKNYSQQAEFVYKEIPPADFSWWSKFKRWFWNLFDFTLNNKTSSSVIKYVVIAALAGLVVFLVVKIIGLDLKIFIGKSKVIEVPYTETLDNIHEINFNQEIDKAVTAGNFRLAIRLFYLQSLKILNDRQLINWQPEKTNQTYVSELKDGNQRIQFSTLTRNFEYIWYGEFFIDRENFNEVKQLFDQFNGKRA